MSDEHENEHAHDHDHEHEDDDSLELELDTQTQIFLEMRQQNLDLLKVAAQVTGFSGNHGPLKPNDLRQALKSIWDAYSEFYSWIDPEVSDDDDGDEDEE
jgi:hypothetical protein